MQVTTSHEVRAAAEHFKMWLVQTEMCMYTKNIHQAQFSVHLTEKQESNISNNVLH